MTDKTPEAAQMAVEALRLQRDLTAQGYWVKKYWTGHRDDPWTPGSLPGRVEDGELRLGWPPTAVEDVAEGDIVAVWISGSDTSDGFYAAGKASRFSDGAVFIRDVKMSADPQTPLYSDRRAAARVGRLRRRVLFIPASGVAECSIDEGGKSCSEGECFTCQFSLERPLASVADPPELIDEELDSYLPAYWVYAARSSAAQQKDPVLRQASDRWYAFKSGDMGLAPFFASAMIRVIDDANLGVRDADAKTVVVPIPLDPEKAVENESHRTLELAKWIEKLSGVGWTVREDLELSEPFSKRGLRRDGWTHARVAEELDRVLGLRVTSPDSGVSHVLLVDDVATRGTTLSAAARLLRSRYPKARMHAATAGQMTVNEAGVVDGYLPTRELSSEPGARPQGASSLSDGEVSSSWARMVTRDEAVVLCGQREWAQAAVLAESIVDRYWHDRTLRDIAMSLTEDGQSERASLVLHGCKLDFWQAVGMREVATVLSSVGRGGEAIEIARSARALAEDVSDPGLQDTAKHSAGELLSQLGAEFT